MSEFDSLEFTETEVAPVLAAQVSGECGLEPASIGPAISKAFDRLGQFLQEHALAPIGPPRAIYTSHGPQGMKFVVAMPIAAPPATPVAHDRTFIGPLAGIKALRFTHRGPYAGLMGTYGQITAFMKTRGLMQSEADWARYMPMWEEYLNDPDTTSQADLLTYIYLPSA